jgi:uncharacterized membrane protein YeiH
LSSAEDVKKLCDPYRTSKNLPLPLFFQGFSKRGTLGRNKELQRLTPEDPTISCCTLPPLVPPAAIHDWRYIAVSILAGLITFYWYRIINRLSSPVLVFDAAGLALFAVSGASKALAFQAGPVAATLLGMLTGIGGGMVRDVLVREIPTVLRTELYAVAALIGAAVVVVGSMLHLPSSGAAIAGVVLCFGLRFIAMRRGWQLPVARSPHASHRSDYERDRHRRHT